MTQPYRLDRREIRRDEPRRRTEGKKAIMEEIKINTNKTGSSEDNDSCYMLL